MIPGPRMRDQPAISNAILKWLRAENLQRLRADFVQVELSMHKVLHSPGKALSHVYFVQNGTLSMVRQLSDGAAVEVGLIGPGGRRIVLQDRKALERAACEWYRTPGVCAKS